MNIAVISFDQDLIKSLAKKLPDNEVKGYTDSLSLLREITFFDPDVIVYDATGGEIALNALEFFLSRDQVKGKMVKVLLSKENPIDHESLSQFSNLDFYYKETEIDKLVNDISGVKTEEKIVEPEEPQSIESFEEAYQPPSDMEALLGDTVSTGETEEIDLTMETESLDDVSELLKEIEKPKTEKPPAEEKPVSTPEEKETTEPAYNSGMLKITEKNKGRSPERLF